MLPILRGLWMRFKLAQQRRRSIRQSRKDIFLRTRLAEVARGGREGEEAEPNVLRRRIAELKQNFADGTAALHSTGADATLRPWYLLLGTPGSGRSTMMASSDLDLIDAGTGPNSPDARLRWWFHPNATILDPAGEVLSPDWGNRGAAEFRQLLKFVEQERKAPELHGAILVIEASKLMGPEEALDAEIGRLRSMLLDMSRVIGLDLPIYILISKCDQIEGMSTVMSSLAQGRQFRQMVGWSASESGMDRFEEPSLRRGLDELCDRMKFVGSSLVSRRDLLLQSDDTKLFRHSAELYSLPRTMRTVSDRLISVASSLFGEVSALHNGHLRGIYLTSVGNLDGEQSSVAMRTSGRFIRDIFVEKIFRERTLAGVSRSRFRKVYLSMLAAVAGLYLVLFLFAFGTITGHSIIDEEANELSLVWSKAEPKITNGDVMLSPVIAPAPGGGYELQNELELYGGRGETRQFFLDEVASNAYEPIPVPAAYRLTSPMMGTFADDLLTRERRQAYRATFNPMVLGPLVSATVDLMRVSDKPWTANSTRAFAGLLQLEQASANLPEDWSYTFDVGPLLVSDLLPFVLNVNEPGGSPADQAGFTAAVGSNVLLSRLGVQAMADSLVAAGTGSVGFAEALVRGLQRYRRAWDDLAYRETLPLGQAEAAIGAVTDFMSAVQEMEELARSVEVYTRLAPTEMQAQSTVQAWNRLNDKVDRAIEAWKRNSTSLSWNPRESLVQLVERATVEGETAVERQFSELLARTVVLGDAQTMRSGQVLGSVAEDLKLIRNKVRAQQKQIARNLRETAKRLDPEVWLKVKKAASETPSIAQTADKPGTETVLAPLVQADVIRLVNARMNERPSGEVANFNVTVSTQAMKNKRLYNEVTEQIARLGSDKSIPAFRTAMLMM
ncbi:MAG: type VI secretion protein IcmF/TssM N-terminal domain-containing protein, partial [Planctomycetota bacterium]|nr:type VI secretion protein IcmF/TssM N-terminal domain-containing protein [Planctomycetota bacterium]